MDELRKIDLNLLLTLHAVLTERHITRAAVRLHRSQPAVSHALVQLRAHFDDPLLIRKNGRMVLTARAEGLLPALQGALFELNALVGATGFDPATAKRRFRIEMSDYAARLILPPLVRHVRASAPGFDLAISQASREMMLAQLDEGEVDLALGIFPDVREGIHQQDLFTERFICLADRRSLPASLTLSLAEWLEKPHVMLAMRPDAIDEIDRVLNRQGLHRHICIALPHWSAAINLLPGTDLVLTVASKTIESGQLPAGIAHFSPPLPLPPLAYQQAWHARKGRDRAHAWLRDAIAAVCSSY